LLSHILKQSSRRLPEAEAKGYLLTLCKVVAHLHERGVAHRDIKAENCLVNKNKQLRLIDFGFAVMGEPGFKVDSYCGTPSYMAPEVVHRKPYCPFPADYWSLGVLYYIMLQGSYPFKGSTE
jgi:serine/threonine protein kinase